MFKVFSKHTQAIPVEKNSPPLWYEMRIKEEEEAVGSCYGRIGEGDGVAGFER